MSIIKIWYDGRFIPISQETSNNAVTTNTTQSITASKTFDGEQKFLNSQYAPAISDTANGIGCGFKASRGLFNQALIDDVIMTGTSNKISFSKYTSANAGQFVGLQEVAKVDSSGCFYERSSASDSTLVPLESKYLTPSSLKSHRRLLTSTIGSRTLTAGDAWYKFYTGNNNITFTIAQGFTVGDEITVIRFGSGTVTFAAGAGVTIYSEGNKRTINAQYQAVTIVFLSGTECVLIGALK